MTDQDVQIERLKTRVSQEQSTVRALKDRIATQSLMLERLSKKDLELQHANIQLQEQVTALCECQNQDSSQDIIARATQIVMDLKLKPREIDLIKLFLIELFTFEPSFDLDLFLEKVGTVKTHRWLFGLPNED